MSCRLPAAEVDAAVGCAQMMLKNKFLPVGINSNCGIVDNVFAQCVGFIGGYIKHCPAAVPVAAASDAFSAGAHNYLLTGAGGGFSCETHGVDKGIAVGPLLRSGGEVR